MASHKPQQGYHLLIEIPVLPAASVRVSEYLFALQHNVYHPLVDGVHVFTRSNHEQAMGGSFHELIYDPESKVQVVVSDQQMTYRDGFTYASERLSGKDVILSNADILLGSGLDLICSDRLFDYLVAPCRYLPNSKGRWRYDPNTVFHHKQPGWAPLEDYIGSHDTFIFRSPLPLSSMSRVGFFMNRLGAENRMMWELTHLPDFPLSTVNPSELVVSYHWHNSDLRTYTAAQSSMQRIDYDKNYLTPYLTEQEIRQHPLFQCNRTGHVASLSPNQTVPPMATSRGFITFRSTATLPPSTVYEDPHSKRFQTPPLLPYFVPLLLVFLCVALFCSWTRLRRVWTRLQRGGKQAKSCAHGLDEERPLVTR